MSGVIMQAVQMLDQQIRAAVPKTARTSVNTWGSTCRPRGCRRPRRRPRLRPQSGVFMDRDALGRLGVEIDHPKTAAALRISCAPYSKFTVIRSPVTVCIWPRPIPVVWEDGRKSREEDT